MPAQLVSIVTHVLLLLTLGFGLSSCDQSTQDSNTAAKKTNEKASITIAEPALAKALQNYRYAQIHALRTTLSCVETLSTNIGQFLATPTQPLLTDNQQALQHCLDLYIPIHTLLQGDSNQTLKALTAPLITSVYSTPILPGYVDYLLQYPNSGIVNDITLALSEQSIRSQQGLTDSGEVSIGFEVIAFILMGEQRYNQSLAARPAIDFEEPHANRRRQYLTVTVSLLQQDLTALQAVLEDTMALSLQESLRDSLQATQQQGAQSTGENDNPLEQSVALQITKNIVNTMLVNIEKQNLDSLSMGYWELLKYSALHNETVESNGKKGSNSTVANSTVANSTLATYLKWPQKTPDLSREAFTAQLNASLQRLQ